MNTNDYYYSLPKKLIAQSPINPRDQSRLLVLNRKDHSLNHHRFSDISNFIKQGDILVFNNSRVIPARLNGIKANSGGKLEILLLRQVKPSIWETLVKPAKRLKIGDQFHLLGENTDYTISGEVVKILNDGRRLLSFSKESKLLELGNIPLPPYIHQPLNNPEKYQTVYAEVNGSVAAPTAGLHFTKELLEQLKLKGVLCVFATLHIGLDTFRPIRENDPQKHQIHREYGIINHQAADLLAQAKKEGRRIICVGTTTVRLIEAVTQINQGNIQPYQGWIDLFILPGYNFQIVDGMITNFHLPKSTLLMLVAAFVGKKFILQAYEEAIKHNYRFYSFGDAMLIL